MSELAMEDPKARITSSFLKWVKDAVDLDIPVFVQRGGEEELSPPLRSISSGLRLLEVSDKEIMKLAKSGEAAARLNKALEEETDAERMRQLKLAYEENWLKFAEDRQELANKYGLSDQQMLSIFKKLTEMP